MLHKAFNIECTLLLIVHVIFVSPIFFWARRATTVWHHLHAKSTLKFKPSPKMKHSVRYMIGYNKWPKGHSSKSARGFGDSHLSGAQCLGQCVLVQYRLAYRYPLECPNTCHMYKSSKSGLKNSCMYIFQIGIDLTNRIEWSCCVYTYCLKV